MLKTENTSETVFVSSENEQKTQKKSKKYTNESKQNINESQSLL